MYKKATVLTTSAILTNPLKSESVVKLVPPNSVIECIREKRRNNKNWYETPLEDGSIGYILSQNIFLWKPIKVDSEMTTFIYTEGEKKNEQVKIFKKHKLNIIAPYGHKPQAYIVQNMQGENGVIPGQTEIDPIEDEWVKVLFYIVFFVILAIAIMIMLEAGYIVFGGLVILILAAVAFVVMLITMILIGIIKGIIRYIQIRR